MDQIVIGGVSSYLWDLLTWLSRCGVDVELGSVGPNHLSQIFSAARAEFGVAEIGSVEGGPIAQALAIKKYIELTRADVVHVHSLPPALLVGALLSDAVPVAHIHESPPASLQTAPLFSKMSVIRRVMRPLMLRRFDLVLTCSESARQFAQRAYGISGERVVTLMNAVDTKRLQASAANHSASSNDCTTVFGFLGRLAAEKNLRFLLGALSLLSDSEKRWHLKIAGDGPLRTSLEEEVVALGISSQVSFVGIVCDAAAFLSDIDVLVQPSLTEGLGMSIIEAMAVEVPAVATRVGGVPECISHEETGLLVPPDDERAFADACARLVADKEFRAALGRQARLIAERRFNIEDTAEALIGHYTALLQRHGSSQETTAQTDGTGQP